MAGSPTHVDVAREIFTNVSKETYFQASFPCREPWNVLKYPDPFFFSEGLSISFLASGISECLAHGFKVCIPWTGLWAAVSGRSLDLSR